MKRGFKLLLCSLLTLSVVVSGLVGCEDDTEATMPVGAADCGDGETVRVEAETYCVYEQSVVVENGFRCPAFVSLLTRFGPIGVCSSGNLPSERLVRVAREHRIRKAEDWEGTDCIGDDECEQGQVCTEEALCAEGEAVLCPEGTERVDGPGDCLQDDATCEEVAPGVWCTGPDAPLMCPEGFEPVEVCRDDRECIEVGGGEARLLCQRPDEEAPCCCEFVIEGDIITEDLLPPDQCGAMESGQCIEVDPNRLTPHPCCPDAQGERCGD